jgi:protein-S-isoprenylcysteine O-methyltransferase
MNPKLYIWITYATWIVVVIYLTITAIRVKPDTKPHYGQSLGLMFAIIAAFLLPTLTIFRFVNFAPLSPTFSVIGIIFTIIGLAFLVWARRTLGKNWSQTVAAKEDHELITSGPYRYVRHPMYTGGLIATIGSAVTAGGAFVFLLILLAPLFIWRTGAEDKLMTAQFPDQYPKYMKRTKKLLPFIW